ncbi:iron-containing alcohol dehydrogenase [Desulfoluna limicola]|nr:iron-containing alcohol dehydrogenase [Desulfoluna limicola]
MNFDFMSAGRIVFGSGTLGVAADEAQRLGRKAFVVAGSSVSRVAPLLEMLSAKDLDYEVYHVTGEPTVAVVQEASALAAGCDLTIAMGGGSVLDTGKAVSALITNKGELMDYLEVIGKGQPLTNPTVPFIAIPTTAGTGTEVTRNAVIGSPEHKVKVSMRSPYMLPDLVVIDPRLTLGLPPQPTAFSGLDALTQLMEAFVTVRANAITDALCREGVMRARRSLQRACEHGDDLEAREDMAVASLFSGFALANAGLGAVHGLAGPLGGMTAAPHGAICASLLPHVMEVNITALKQRVPDSPGMAKYLELAAMLTGDGASTVDDGVAWVRKLCDKLEIPSLSDLGFNQGHIAEAVVQGRQASSMKGNPIELTDKELETILRRASRV